MEMFLYFQLLLSIKYLLTFPPLQKEAVYGEAQFLRPLFQNLGKPNAALTLCCLFFFLCSFSACQTQKLYFLLCVILHRAVGKCATWVPDCSDFRNYCLMYSVAWQTELRIHLKGEKNSSQNSTHMINIQHYYLKIQKNYSYLVKNIGDNISHSKCNL